METDRNNYKKMSIDELEREIKNTPCRGDGLALRYEYALRLFNGDGCLKNECKALNLFEGIAKYHTDASLLAGRCNFYGKGTSQNYEEALKYFTYMCTSGERRAEGFLWSGKCLLKMNRKEEAFIKIKKAAERPVTSIKEEKIRKEAQCLLGMCCYYGVQVEQNLQEAVEYFKQAALGNGARLDAQYYLAKCYQEGKGTEQDLKRAEHWRSECFETDYQKIACATKELLGIDC